MTLIDRSSRARSKSCMAAARSSLPPLISRLMRNPSKRGMLAPTSNEPLWMVPVLRMLSSEVPRPKVAL